MKLNTSKCEIMRALRRTCDVSSGYLLNNVSFSNVTSYKDLGVTISDLSWQTDIGDKKNNFNRTHGYLRRNFSLAPMELKLLLYKTLARSKLEYSSSVLNPQVNIHIISLESIQNRAARFILPNYSRMASVTHMKLTLNRPAYRFAAKFHACAYSPRFYQSMPSLVNSRFSAPS